MKRKIKRKTSKSKTVRRSKTKKVVRRAKAKKVVRRAKPKIKAKSVRGRKCPPRLVAYTKIRRFVSYQPSDIDCMRLAKQFGKDRMRYHAKHFCRLGSCKPGAKCTTIIYYCYRFTAQGNGGRLLMTAKGLCKCMVATNPPTHGLVIYNCNRCR